MALCFIFSAISFILVLSQIYSFMSVDKPQVASTDKQNETNPPKIAPPPKDDFFRGMPKDSPMMFTFFLFGFLISLFAGIVIYENLQRKERKNIKQELLKTKKETKANIIDKMLLPEEKVVIELLKNNSGTLTQTELVRQSNLNKLKVSRIIKKLHSLHLVDKYPHGMTNKIKLKK